MKKASPSTRSCDNGTVESNEVERRARAARMWACATFRTYVKSKRFSLEPSWNEVFPDQYTESMLGIIWTSPGPKIPAGRRAQVKRDGEEGERLEARTWDSACAWEGEGVSFCGGKREREAEGGA